MAQDHMAFTFASAATCGPYDEIPTLPDDLDIQLTLSKNDRPQPFHLICQHDTILVAMSGSGRVNFAGSPVLYHDYRVGDLIYVPAGTPHRIVPSAESVVQRFKLPESDLEGVAWFCDECGKQLHREVWRLADELPQEGYLRACNAFNAAPEFRNCSQCGASHPPVDLSGFRWETISRAQRSARSEKER